MAQLTRKQLISDLARDAIAKVAPQELPMFRAQSEAYFADPDGALESQAGKGEILGFGGTGAATFLTPSVLAVVAAVVSFIVEAVTGTVQEEAEGLISDAVKGLFKKLRPAEETPGDEESEDEGEPFPLTTEQLQRLRKLAYEKAIQLRLSERTAETLADALIGSLVVAPDP